MVRYNYGIIVQSDIPEEAKRREILDVCQIACEKFAAAEKTPLERDNQAAAEMIKVCISVIFRLRLNVDNSESSIRLSSLKRY